MAIGQTQLKQYSIAIQSNHGELYVILSVIYILVSRLKDTSVYSSTPTDIPGVDAATMIVNDQTNNAEFLCTYNDVDTNDIFVSPNTSLYEACSKLQRLKARALPIYDEDCCFVVGVVSHLKVLRYLWNNFSEERLIFENILSELNIGRYLSQNDFIPKAKLDTPLKDILELNQSAVPIVDDEGKPISMFFTGKVFFINGIF